jgi:hypothetical protein
VHVVQERTTNPYSTALRMRAVHAYENCEGAMRQLGTTCRGRLSCVRRLLTHNRATGSVAPKPPSGGGHDGGRRSGRSPLPAVGQEGLVSQLRPGQTDAGAPPAGDRRGVCGNHEPGCSGLLYPCWLWCSFQLKSAVRPSHTTTEIPSLRSQ